MPNRTVCSVLEEIRKLNDTRNYSSLSGLIEELQFMVNRMEASLWDQYDIVRLREERSQLKAEVKQLKADKPKPDENPLTGGGPFIAGLD